MPPATQEFTQAQHARQVGETRIALEKQKKFIIFLPQPHGSKPEQCTHKDAHINGLAYRLRYGKAINVPESLYLVLIQSGDTMPQREEDVVHLPKAPDVPIWRETIDS